MALATVVTHSVCKVAIVTGGARGIGRAVVEKLVSDGLARRSASTWTTAGSPTWRTAGSRRSRGRFHRVDMTSEADSRARRAPRSTSGTDGSTSS